MTSQLSLYNGALDVLGERNIETLTDNVESRKKLDKIWANDLRERVLQHGLWNFAARSAELTASPSITPDFGYQYAFDKPDDFVRTMAVCYDEYFDRPLTRYEDESQWWFADVEIIYVQYVSKDTQFGLDFSLWPPNFTEYVEHYMAHKVAPRLTGLDLGDRSLKKETENMLKEAKSTDAMESPAKFPPTGNWANSRQGFRSGTTDRGSRNRLIG